MSFIRACQWVSIEHRIHLVAMIVTSSYLENGDVSELKSNNDCEMQQSRQELHLEKGTRSK